MSRHKTEERRTAVIPIQIEDDVVRFTAEEIRGNWVEFLSEVYYALFRLADKRDAPRSVCGNNIAMESTHYLSVYQSCVACLTQSLETCLFGKARMAYHMEIEDHMALEDHRNVQEDAVPMSDLDFRISLPSKKGTTR